MKSTLTSILWVLIAFVGAVLLNCGLIYLGYLGLILSCALIFVLLFYFIVEGDLSVITRILLAACIGILYVHTIWYPDVTIAAIMGLAVSFNLLTIQNEKLSMRTSLMMWYFVSWNVAFYIMGDPVLEWADAVLALTAVICSGLWLYQKAQTQKGNT